MKIAAVVLLFQVVLSGQVLAQDFDSLVASARDANERWVEQIDLALQADDLSTLQARTATAVAIGEQVESLLSAALPLAPDDAGRSRVEGLLTHVRAALDAGRMALEETDFDVARSRVDAMRGEAEEALAEFPSEVPQVTPTPEGKVPGAAPVEEVPEAVPTAVEEVPEAVPTAVEEVPEAPIAVETPARLPEAGQAGAATPVGGSSTGALALAGLAAALMGLTLRRRLT